ncbi:MFS transporter [Saccharibacillus qingshengii]|uniref:MFS transporter n=1 Tax=Saccharibacillus qingshengii TaxID=1763540 RepID=UPI002483E546|nr:MFS transporter [Saccharibacillus qingshengii]
MLFYNGSETAVGLWAASYLIAGKGLAVNEAAAYSSLYFIGIIVGRILSGFLSEHLSAKRLIRYGILIGALGLWVLIGSSGMILAGIGLFVLGFGGAPIYPSLVHMTPERFGKKASQSVIGLEMASAYTGSTVIPLLVGLVVGSLGMAVMPVVFLLLFAAMFVSSILMR